MRAGRRSEFRVTPVSRRDLYGHVRRIALDEVGRECQTALLTRDGQYLLPAGSTADLYLDGRGNSVARPNVKLPAGRVGIGQESGALDLVGPVPASDLLDGVATRVYWLEPRSIDRELEADLRDGGAFSVPGYIKMGQEDTSAYLVGNRAGFFLLVLRRYIFEFLGWENAIVPDDENDSWQENADFDPFEEEEG